LFVFHRRKYGEDVCAVSINDEPTARRKIMLNKNLARLSSDTELNINNDGWIMSDPDLGIFSFNKAYFYYRSRTISGGCNYKYHKNVIICFFRNSLSSEELQLLDKYNSDIFLLILFMRRALINHLIERNAALALLLIRTNYARSLQNKPDTFWSHMRDEAQLSPSQIFKRMYHPKINRKAANILHKIDTRGLPNIKPLEKLISCLRDDWIVRVLDKLPQITYEILLIVLDKQNRNILNAGFLHSLADRPKSEVSAPLMLQWLHIHNIHVPFPLKNVRQLHAIYTYMKKHRNLSSMKGHNTDIPSFFAWPDAIPEDLESMDNQEDHKNNPLRIPHRLETASDITLAQHHNVLGLGKETYQRLLHVRKNKRVIYKPAALRKARPVSKDFFVLKEKKITLQHESYKQSEGLSSISHDALIKEQIPCLKELIDHEYLDVYMDRASNKMGSKGIHGRAYTLMRHRKLREIIRDELRSLVQCNRTKALPREELKRLIVALTLHDNRNKDALQAVKMARATDDNILLENALAEVLFKRIPDYIKSLFVDDPKITVVMRQRLLSRISKLSVSANLKIALFHMVPRIYTRNKADFIAMLNRMLSFIERVGVINETSKRSFRSFIDNTIGELKRLESMYTKMFLSSKELENCYFLYVPNKKLVTCSLTHSERIIQEHCSRQSLSMYPSKDYLDLEKYRWSRDCTSDSRGLNHLLTPQYFSIRLFKNNQEYCGNIYMLQLEYDSRHYLLIDRIQTSTFDTRYVMFYQILRDAFLVMFEKFPFHEILLPNTDISNNKSLNQIYHSTKKSFPKKQMYFKFPVSMRSHFESLRMDTFHVLCAKTLCIAKTDKMKIENEHQHI
jgi:hypothetical protein